MSGSRPARRVEAAVLLGLAAVLRPLPPRVRIAVGHVIGRAAWLLLGRRRRLARANAALSLDLEPRQAARVARGAFRHFGRVLVECLCLPAYARPRELERLEVRGLEHLAAASARGHGVIVFSAHFGNWELVALRQALSGYPMDFIARPLDNPQLEAAFAEWREKAGNRVLGKRGALRRALGTLREGRALAILIDQNVHAPPRLFLPFLGRPATVTPSLGQLAVRCDAPVVPVVSRARPDGGYDITYLPELRPPEQGSRDERALALTRAAVRLVESWIRETPDQWLWLHDRWKSTPGPGEEVLR